MRIFSLILFLFLPCVLSAKDYLASSPQEAQVIFNNAIAGDRVFLRNGVYKNAIIKLNNTKGTATQPIVFAAETQGKVFFEGGSTLSLSGRYLLVKDFTWRNGSASPANASVVAFKNGKEYAFYSTVSNCVIDAYNSLPAAETENKWVSFYGDHNTLENCLLKNKTNRGATVTVWLNQGEPAYHTIAGNYFFKRGNAGHHDNGLESIRIGDSETSFTAAHCVVALNRFEDCDGEIEIISNKSCRNSYLYNTFFNNDGGLTLRHGNACVADGNYFDGGQKKLSYGIRFIGEDHVAVNNFFKDLHGAPHQVFRAPVTFVNGIENSVLNGYFQVKNAVLRSNIFVNCDAPCIRVGAHTRKEATAAPEGISILENIFANEKGVSGVLYEEKERPSQLHCAENLVQGYAKAMLPEGFSLVKEKRWKMGSAKLESIVSGDTSLSEKYVPDLSVAGADWLPLVLSERSGAKFILLSPAEVGPLWLR